MNGLKTAVLNGKVVDSSEKAEKHGGSTRDNKSARSDGHTCLNHDYVRYWSSGLWRMNKDVVMAVADCDVGAF